MCYHHGNANGTNEITIKELFALSEAGLSQRSLLHVFPDLYQLVQKRRRPADRSSIARLNAHVDACLQVSRTTPSKNE
ncbi:hypothetical protein FRC03_006857 [Tulasnella sp. 419]|nr:hypothetical protein FRC02_008213 [Tulasnella sp. 418]KAG8960237.1 hypothetical protein FRC03_006857 [Tulasnella sp. 419]